MPENAGKNFADALGEELLAIKQSRRERKVEAGANIKVADNAELDEVREKAAKLQLFALAFSGGGIRSATFNLGVAQALAEKKLLRRADYLSTVSGGGYIGSWLHACAHREGEGGIRAVEKKIARSSRGGGRGAEGTHREPYEVRFLRRFSNYLTPRLGFFGADTWTLISRYLGNLIVTQLVLSASILALMATFLAISAGVTDAPSTGWTVALFVTSNVALAMGFFFGIRTWPNLARRPGAATNVQLRIVLPIFTAGLLAALALAGVRSEQPWPLDVSPYVLLPILLATMSTLMWQLVMKQGQAKGGEGPIVRAGLKRRLLAIPGTVISGVLGGVLLALIVGLYAELRTFDDGARWIFCLGPPLVCLVFWLTVTIQMALSGTLFSDSNMEWWSRVGAWLLIYCVGWFGFLYVTFFGPLVIAWVSANISAAGGLSVWLIPTVTGLLAANNPSTGGRGANRLLEIVAKLGPYVFFLGLLCSIAWVLDLIPGSNDWTATGVVVGLAAVGLLVLLVSQYDVNRYSMHSFYRNRLVRCYLGASTRDRSADRFTGFFATDDLPLSQIDPSKGAPLPIINTTLNLVQSTDLAWQERKGASFTFTPLSSGYAFPETEPAPSKDDVPPPEAMRAFRNTKEFGAEYADAPGGISLGSCVAISGAAASPNMGYHSSPVLALLLTWFNIRSGAWVGNPLHGPWRWQGPKFGRGVVHLLKELLGLTDDQSDFLYLSDGGHFDNLGVYELVRRRCRHILAIDAGCDPNSQFDDLGNLIRKCRTDLGVHIAIDVEQLKKDAQSGKSARHCTVGRVYYPRDGKHATPVGTIIYIKPSLTGDEAADVRNYAARHPSFPHESTADQFFGESQFESYRKLGRHIANDVINCVWPLEADAKPAPSTDELFEQLLQRWFPQSQAVAANFSRHGELLEELFEQARSDDNLVFLDWQFYPEWHEVIGAAKSDEPLPKDPMHGSQWLPETYEERRAGFYFCNSLIQLMENVYLDLKLEQEWSHPDNRGWVNLFKHWSWSGMFRVTWAVSACTYGFRFVAFCERYLGLKLGREDVETVKPGRGATLSKKLIAAAEREDKANRLNFFELYQIRQFVEQHGKVLDGKQAVELRLLRLHVDDHRKLVVNDTSGGFAFTFGFAIVYRTKSGERTAYMRMQDHLHNRQLEQTILARLPEPANLKPPDERAPEPA